MVLSPEAEDAFNQAIEAAYAMHAPGITSEERRLARKAYEHLMEDYFLLTGDDGKENWWDNQSVMAVWEARCKESA